MESLSFSKKYTKDQFKSLGAFLTKHGFTSSTLSKTTSYNIQRSEAKAVFTKSSKFLYPRVKNIETMPNISEELEQLKPSSKLFENLEIRTAVDLGDAFETIHELMKVFGDEEKFSVEHKPGQVLLVDFWATW